MYQQCLGSILDALDDYMNELELCGDRKSKKLRASLFDSFCYLVDLYFDQSEVVA